MGRLSITYASEPTGRERTRRGSGRLFVVAALAIAAACAAFLLR